MKACTEGCIFYLSVKGDQGAFWGVLELRAWNCQPAGVCYYVFRRNTNGYVDIEGIPLGVWQIGERSKKGNGKDQWGWGKKRNLPKCIFQIEKS